MQRIDWNELQQNYFSDLTQKPVSKLIDQTCQKKSVDLCNMPTSDEVADLRSAVAYLPRAISESGETFSFDRKAWIDIGMCLKTIPDEALAYELWILFSQSCPEQFDLQDCIDTWDGLNPTETHWRSIFKKAQDAGWINPRKKLTNTTSEQTNNIGFNPLKPLEWADKFTLTDDQIDAIADPEWIITNLIIRGHFSAIVAEPNGGKTTLLMHLAAEIVKKGFDVCYTNSDTSGGDAKSMHKFANENNFKLMLPDMASGSLSMNDVVNQLEAMSVTDCDFSNIVFIFDTLKKMTDVINKQKSKKLYKLLRSLTSKGMTIIALGHTNKHRTDGELMYEGTGDLRADTDELIYLIQRECPMAQ